MRRIERINGKWTNTNYILDISTEWKIRAWDFATKIIYGDNQYNRILPFGIDEDTARALRIQRTYIGKLAELVFLNFLHEKGIEYEEGDMFEIYEGQTETDSYDFVLKNGQTIDVKAAFRDCHQNLVVNKEQFENIPKDIYVGVKLNAKDLDASKKLVDCNSVTQGEIVGYTQYDYLKNKFYNDKAYTNFGESDCKAILLKTLMPIDKLISFF